MSDLNYAVLPDRGVLSVSGPDARSFLQGLISNDIEKVGAAQAIHAALLTPQGKYLFDFFIYELDGGLLLDCEAGRIADLAKRLSMYKLRADADLADVSDAWTAVAMWGPGAAAAADLADHAGAAAPWSKGVIAVDPRLAGAGLRALLPASSADATLAASGFAAGTTADYDSHRLEMGLPDGSRDLVIDKSILLESGFDELGGVDWEKGCYMGQELTARTKYRGLVKKRLVPVDIDGPVPDPGTPVMIGDKEAGEMRSARDGRGLALMRLEHLEDSNAQFSAGEASISPRKPDWATF